MGFEVNNKQLLLPKDLHSKHSNTF